MSTETLLKIAAAYVRVSDERQDEYSPDSQLKLARERAARDGYMIPDEYVFYDDGISGKSTKRRAEFNRMIAFAKEKDHPFDRIYVWKFSRFARNQEESIVYKNLLAKKGVEVMSVSEPIPEGPFGALIERIIEWMDEFYVINLSAEVSRGMAEKASRGEPNNAPPYGYIMKEGKFVIDEAQAEIVREIFRRFVDGEGERTIAMDLRDRGVLTKSGSSPSKRWVNYILRNACYIGKIRWSTNGSKAVSKRKIKENADSVIIVDGHHEPIISEELFEKAQKRAEDLLKTYPVYARREQPIQFMLKGIVRCDVCGSTLACNGKRSGKAQNLGMQCCGYARGACKVSHYIVVNKANEAVIAGLEKAIGTKEFIISPKKPENAKSDGVDYNKLIAVEERKLERARAAYLAEIDTLEIYAHNKSTIEKRIEDLRKMQATGGVKKAVDVDALAAKVSGVLEFIKREDVAEEAKNEALRSIVEKIVYEKAKNNLAIYFYEL